MTFNFWRIYQAHHHWGMYMPYRFSYCQLPTYQSCYVLWLKEQTDNSTLYSDLRHHLPPPSPSLRMDGTTYVDPRSILLQIMHIEYKIGRAPFVFISMIALLRGHRGWRYSSRNLCIQSTDSYNIDLNSAHNLLLWCTSTIRIVTFESSLQK